MQFFMDTWNYVCEVGKRSLYSARIGDHFDVLSLDTRGFFLFRENSVWERIFSKVFSVT